MFIILLLHINNIAYFDCRYTVFNRISTNITFHINTHYIPSYHYIPLSLSTSFILSITLIQHYIPLSITFYLHIALKLSTSQFNTFYNLTNKSILQTTLNSLISPSDSLYFCTKRLIYTRIT